MKCNYCEAEWQLPAGRKPVTVCPFCGKALEPEKKQVQSIEDALAIIYSDYGQEAMLDGKQVACLLTDIVPLLKRERNLVNVFYSCGGVAIVNENGNTWSSYQQEKGKVCMRMKEEWGITEDNSGLICDSFFKAIGGSIPDDILLSIKEDAAPDTTENSHGSAASTTGEVQTNAPVVLPTMNTSTIRDGKDGQNKTDDKRPSWFTAAWFKKQAKAGFPGAQYRLGICYSEGLGVQKDEVQAVFWIQKAAEQGYLEAQQDLADRYNNGHGVAFDYRQAAYWKNKADKNRQDHSR
jgi:hypothetical protein